jgi:hypothetical protein
MPSLVVNVAYRPIRIGWCVREGNWDHVRKALRLTHTLWGGRYNPIIPVDNRSLASDLVNLFRVDALFPLADNDDSLKKFVEAFPWLPWPSFHKGLFVQGSAGTVATFLDIYHPVRHLFDDYIKGRTDRQFVATQFSWENGDPLADVFLCTFGQYPSKKEISKDYDDFVTQNLRAVRVKLKLTEELSPDIFQAFTLSTLTGHMLEWEVPPREANAGLYVGSSTKFEDIVNFWNIRATDAQVFFFDPAQEQRIGKSMDQFVQGLDRRAGSSASWTDRPPIWALAGELAHNRFKANAVRHDVTADTWNGYNLKPARFYIGEKYSLLASLDETIPEPSLSIQLPEKPFFAEPEFHVQELAVEIWVISSLRNQSEFVFDTPFIPEMNVVYGRNLSLEWNKARAETPGISIITGATSDHITLRSVLKHRLMSAIFETFGMKAELSKPGRIAMRLIQQMGGIQGCRVFKIPGVRDLIAKFGPQTPFTRSGAVQTIGRNDPTGAPQFSEYEGLYIEFREQGPLKPEHAFTFLLKRGVFQTGLSLVCPNCELDSWTQLDDLATEIKCELCGKQFLITPQLRDRDWNYRRSGLFGRDNHQEGTIPVAVSLQQIDTVLHSAILSTNMDLSPKTATIEECETDLVVIEQGYLEDKVSIAIGECKTGGLEISEEDVRKLSKVADALDRDHLESYIIFSKLAPFSEAEVERCRRAQTLDRYRVILLSNRELEPYFVYERTEKEFAIRSTAISLEDLAAATHDVYFNPRLRPMPAPKQGAQQ